jgi:beta-phosphoglucomutase-like phosphatase (HAD superfamily)
MLADFPRCVASGTPLPILRMSLRATNLQDQFGENLFTAEMVTRGKPAPDLFLYAAGEMGFAPEDCIVIEDSVPGVQAACAASMRVVAFTGGGHCLPGHAEKLAGAARIINDMRTLPETIHDVLACGQQCGNRGKAVTPGKS